MNGLFMARSHEERSTSFNLYCAPWYAIVDMKYLSHNTVFPCVSHRLMLSVCTARSCVNSSALQSIADTGASANFLSQASAVARIVLSYGSDVSLTLQTFLNLL